MNIGKIAKSGNWVGNAPKTLEISMFSVGFLNRASDVRIISGVPLKACDFNDYRLLILLVFAGLCWLLKWKQGGNGTEANCKSDCIISQHRTNSDMRSLINYA